MRSNLKGLHTETQTTSKQGQLCDQRCLGGQLEMEYSRLQSDTVELLMHNNPSKQQNNTQPFHFPGKCWLKASIQAMVTIKLAWIAHVFCNRMHNLHLKDIVWYLSANCVAQANKKTLWNLAGPFTGLNSAILFHPKIMAHQPRGYRLVNMINNM